MPESRAPISRAAAADRSPPRLGGGVRERTLPARCPLQIALQGRSRPVKCPFSRRTSAATDCGSKACGSVRRGPRGPARRLVRAVRSRSGHVDMMPSARPQIPSSAAGAADRSPRLPGGSRAESVSGASETRTAPCGAVGTEGGRGHRSTASRAGSRGAGTSRVTDGGTGVSGPQREVAPRGFRRPHPAGGPRPFSWRNSVRFASHQGALPASCWGPPRRSKPFPPGDRLPSTPTSGTPPGVRR